MTNDELDASLRAFSSRRPFRHFTIEFTSGSQVQVKHPEAVRRRDTFTLRSADAGSRLLRFFRW
jgi:hypothetical protein